jgi:predicted Fe-S protein YdhL (DUF1289 family)
MIACGEMRGEGGVQAEHGVGQSDARSRWLRAHPWELQGAPSNLVAIDRLFRVDSPCEHACAPHRHPLSRVCERALVCWLRLAAAARLALTTQMTTHQKEGKAAANAASEDQAKSRRDSCRGMLPRWFLAVKRQALRSPGAGKPCGCVLLSQAQIHPCAEGPARVPPTKRTRRSCTHTEAVW